MTLENPLAKTVFGSRSMALDRLSDGVSASKSSEKAEDASPLGLNL
jgi:hypothetical protein